MTAVDLKGGHLCSDPAEIVQIIRNYPWPGLASPSLFHQAAEVGMMKVFLATVLSVIAMGVMLIAYGLFNPRIAAAGAYQTARPMLASERVGLIEEGYAPTATYPASQAYAPAYATGRPAMAYPVNDTRAVPVVYETAPAPRRVYTEPRATRTTASTVERSSGRDWKKTAMVIGGTTAAAAGVGAIFGGKKGALIGAAIGGGAGTIYEVRKR
jgi:hypothetical protein